MEGGSLINSVLDKLDQLRLEAEKALAEVEDSKGIDVWVSEFIGRKGRLTGVLRNLGSLPNEERPKVGEAANKIKKSLESAAEDRKQKLIRDETESVLRAEVVDITLPGRPQTLGKLHPTTTTLREIYNIFAQMGFQIYDSFEVETDEYNFELLNMPVGHPARDMWDTFYTETPDLILRTHTSPGQIHAMREFSPEPIRAILPGKVYRYEKVTARSESMFYQVEGIAIGKNITFSDLKGVITNFADQMYGQGRHLRFRKSYFPFTEPSVEVDVDCILCGGKGCLICKDTGWLEIMGAGMMHPIVLKNGGYDPTLYSGFAFGMGPERIAMLKHGIDDIRYFYTNDVRFLERIG